MNRDEMKAEIAAIDTQLPPPNTFPLEEKHAALRIRRRWLCEQLAGWHYGQGNSGPRPEEG
jgi:hypothetical protein